MTTQAARAATDGGSETARLYDTYGRQLYRYCLARLRSPEEAEDALQSIFVRIYASLCKGVEPRFETAWVYKIAQNVCVTRSTVNGKRARFETPVDFSELDVAAAEGDSDVLLELEPALASLPKNLRDAILLREWQGLSYAEIAAELHTTVPAVETLIFRARRRLASALRPVGTGLVDVLSLPSLVARVRGALASAGTAKVAAGAAVVAIGAVGTTTVVARADHPRPVQRVEAPRVTAPVAQVAVSHVVGRRTHRTHPTHVSHANAATPVVVTPAVRSAPKTAPVAPAATPAQTPPPAPAEPPAAAPAAAPAEPVPAVVATPAAVTPVAAVVPTIAAALPTIAPPAVPVVSVPTVTDVTATVAPPPVTVPTLP